MALDPALERPRLSEDPAFSDAVTCAFADVGAGVQGSVRIGLTADGASGLIMVFVDGQPAVAQAEGAIAVPEAPQDYASVQAAGIDHEVLEPHRRWRTRVESVAGRLDLTFEATGPALVLDPATRAARLGGMEGYEQPCRVTGTVTLLAPAHTERTIPIDSVGQRGHQWGAPDWSTISLSRTVTGWFGDDLAFNVSALRPAKGRSHADEIAWSTVTRPAPPDGGDEEAGSEDDEVVEELATGPVEAVGAPEPRISTTTDETGRHTHATVELWESDEGPVWTATGEAISGTTIELGRMRLDMAFFRWRLRGRTGVGRYDVLRRLD
jgi:hypothetical protein